MLQLTESSLSYTASDPTVSPALRGHANLANYFNPLLVPAMLVHSSNVRPVVIGYLHKGNVASETAVLSDARLELPDLAHHCKYSKDLFWIESRTGLSCGSEAWLAAAVSDRRKQNQRSART